MKTSAWKQVEKALEEDSSIASLIRRKAARLVRHPAFTISDADDVQQELLLELGRRLGGYDRTRGNLAAFVSCIVDSKAASLVRARTAEKRDYHRNGPSLNEMITARDGTAVERAAIMDTSANRRHLAQISRSDRGSAELRHDLSQVLDTLPPHLRTVAETLAEHSALEAGRLLERSRYEISSDISSIRDRFEQAGLSAYSQST